ncbi:MAG: hypothetical protein JWN70_768 [Planctomycetaceae bacterium]|nr:hypothetical protein [Planctomycetaceae bacterium]
MVLQLRSESRGFRMLAHKRREKTRLMIRTWTVISGLVLFGLAASTGFLSYSEWTSPAVGDEGPQSKQQAGTNPVPLKLNAVRILSPRPPSRWEAFPRATPLDAQRIVDRLEKFLAAGRQLQQPGVLVLPITDSQGRVRADGLGLCYQAMLAVERSATPSQIGMDAETALATLLDAGCDRIGTTINDRLRNACTRSAGAQLSVTTTLADKRLGWELTVTLHTLDSAPESTKHTIGRGQINTIPGIIASEICRHLKVTLNAEQHQRMLKPQTTSDEASALLGDLIRKRPTYENEWMQYERFLRLNPDCVAAWRFLMGFTTADFWNVKWLNRINPKLGDPQLGLALVLDRLRWQPPETCYLDLEQLAAELPGNPAIHPAMLSCILYTGDMRAFDKALAAWRRDRQGYVDFLSRGRFLIQCAQRRPPDKLAAREESPERVRQWQEEARAELLKAVQLHPDGWQAHTRLMSLTTVLGRPRDELEQHFAAAISVIPGHRAAYRCKLQFLSPHQHGTIEEIAACAEECVKTGRWDEGIPQLFLEAVRLATTDLSTSSTSFQAYRNARLWQAAQVYRAEDEKSGKADDQRVALNYFVFLAAVSGHAAEVQKEFKLLHADYAQHTYLRAVFESHITFQFLSDLSLAQTESDPKSAEIAQRLAASAGDLDQAAKLQPSPAPAPFGNLIQSHRAAAELGRRLIADRDVLLTPSEILSTFIVQGDTDDGVVPLAPRNQFGWTAEQESLVWKSKASVFAGVMNLYFPVGMRHGIISGEIEVSGSIGRLGIQLHTRALRDVITVMYMPDRGLVSVSRARHELATSPWTSQVIPFRFEFGAKEDILEPIPGFRLTTPVLDDVPSGFAFEAQDNGTGLNTTTVSLRKLRIQILD